MSKLTRRGMNYNRASAGSGRGISASQYNGLLDMHRDLYANSAGQSPLPPVLQNSVIVAAVLREGSDDVAPYQPVRITKQLNFIDTPLSVPSYEVEAVDSVDTNGDPTDRHGNYGFAVAEGVSAEQGGRIVISGVALVAITRDQAVEGSSVASNYLGSPFGGYSGEYNSSYYVINDGTILDDTDVRLAPIGHFRVLSWYDPSSMQTQAPDADSAVYVLIDLSQRFTTGSVELFASVSGYSGEYNDQTFNQGYVYFERPLAGVPAVIADVNPRIGNNGNPANIPSIKNGESNYFRCLATNTNLYDISEGTHAVSYSAAYNRLIFIGDPLHNDGRINTWYTGIDPDELVSRGHTSGFEITGGWGNNDDDNTDSCPYPSSFDLTALHAAEGRITLAANYMTQGGSAPSVVSKGQGVPAMTADAIAPAVVLMLADEHEYATFCEAWVDENVLVSCSFGEFKILDKSPLHNNAVSAVFPQWNRCLGFLKNESAMSALVEVTNINGTAHTGTKHAVVLLDTPEGFKEVTVATVKTNVTGLTRKYHEDDMPQSQYQGSITFMPEQTFGQTGTLTIDATTLYKYAVDTTLRVWGVEADGTETQLDSSSWDNASTALYQGTTVSMPTQYNCNFFWDEKYKFIYFDLETAATAFPTVTGTVTLHRRTNFGGDAGYSSGRLTLPTDLTLPAWPTYANGDIESAGVKYDVR